MTMLMGVIIVVGGVTRGRGWRVLFFEEVRISPVEQGFFNGRERKAFGFLKAESRHWRSSSFFCCPPGGVLFWLGRPKKEPKKLGFPAWPPPSPA